MDQKLVLEPKQLFCCLFSAPHEGLCVPMVDGPLLWLYPKAPHLLEQFRKIGGLDKGPLTKDERREIAHTGVKSATIKVNKKGRKTYSGTAQLRGTGWGA